MYNRLLDIFRNFVLPFLFSLGSGDVISSLTLYVKYKFRKDSFSMNVVIISFVQLFIFPFFCFILFIFYIPHETQELVYNQR